MMRKSRAEKKMREVSVILLVWMIIFPAFSGCIGKEKEDLTAEDIAAKIRGEFWFAWKGYEKYAWGHDELRPLTRTYRDWYEEPLAITIIDSLDSLYLLGFKSEFENAVNWVINNISFDKDIDAQVFETNIRLLGGLISAYQISGEEELLILSIDLANRLLPAFDSPTGMPYRFVNLKTGKVSGNTSNPAEIGTLSLEFGTLSKLTKNQVYYDKVKNAVKALYERRSKLDLVGSGINVETGEWTDEMSHIGGCIDSFYEYLWKSWVLFGDKEFLDMYATCIGAVKKHLAEVYEGRLWYKRVDMNTGKLINRHFGALDLFLPGLFASSNQVSRGEKLIQSGYYMWNEWGIEPELIDYSTMSVLNPGYVLRPELMESTYHLWKLTGNPQYRERGYAMFESIVRDCKSNVGYARIKDVRTMEKEDLMDSFFFAETLKYAYLLFDDSGLNYNLTVFNTEAHPFQILRD